jgi:uncharacterized damage-inducible protein DinB
MNDSTTSLMPFYKGWARYQKSLVEMIAPLTAEQLALPAGSHEWTIGEVLQHMAGDRIWWYQTWMGEGSPELAYIAHWDPADPIEQPALSAAELVAGFNATWEMIVAALNRWTPSDLEQVFTPPQEMSEAERQATGNTTRQWIIWHVLEHEIHHGGEVSLALGMHGLPGIYGSR